METNFYVDIAHELGRLANAGEETSRQMESLARKLDGGLQLIDQRLVVLERDRHSARLALRFVWLGLSASAAALVWLWEHFGALR